MTNHAGRTGRAAAGVLVFTGAVSFDDGPGVPAEGEQGDPHDGEHCAPGDGGAGDEIGGGS